MMKTFPTNEIFVVPTNSRKYFTSQWTAVTQAAVNWLQSNWRSSDSVKSQFRRIYRLLVVSELQWVRVNNMMTKEEEKLQWPLTLISCSKLLTSSPSTCPVWATRMLRRSALRRRYCRMRQVLLACSSCSRSSCSWYTSSSWNMSRISSISQRSSSTSSWDKQHRNTTTTESYIDYIWKYPSV